MVAIPAWPTAAMAYQVFFRGLGQFIWLAGGWFTCLLGCVVVKMLPWPDAIASLLVVRDAGAHRRRLGRRFPSAGIARCWSRRRPSASSR